MSDDDNESSSCNQLPSAEDVKREVGSEAKGARSQERKYTARFSRMAPSAQERYAHLKGLRDHYKHKTKWSWFLLAAIGYMILFQSGIIVSVGMKWLDFIEYKWLLPALLVQNLAQVIGLAVFVVKALFKDLK